MKRLRNSLCAFALCLLALWAVVVPARAADELKDGYYTYIELGNGTAAITGYTGSDTSLTIPESVGGCSVVRINSDAFRNRKDLIAVTIPNSVETISAYAFDECTNLKSITFSNNLKNIMYNAFSNCLALQEVILPDSVESVGESAFYECRNVNTLKLSSKLEVIHSYAFGGMTSLTELEIPTSITEINDNAFSGANFSCVHYKGTKDQWSRIKIGGGNGNLKSAVGHTWNDNTCTYCGFGCEHTYDRYLMASRIEVKCTKGCGYLEKIPLSVDKGFYTGGVYWFGGGKEATVVAPDVYSIGTNADGPFGTSVNLSQDDGKDIYLRKGDSTIGPFNLSSLIKWDITGPAATITTTSEFMFGSMSQIENPVCTNFTKEPVSMMFVVNDYVPDGIDEESGVSQIEYYVSDTAQTDPTSLEYVIYDDRYVSLHQNGKYFIYARVTDNVGNVTYINTPGLVIYEDSSFGDEVAECFYKMGWNWLVRFNTNGNTINEVKVGNQKLVAGTDYEVVGSYLNIKPAYIGTLDVGEYELTVSVNPQGETYLDYPNNEAPMTLSLPFEVKKMPLIKVAAPALKSDSIYNTQAQELLTKNETVKGTYEYAIGTDDTNLPVDGWSADVPTATNAGTYHLWFRATPEDTENYEGTTGHYLGEVTIAKAVPSSVAFPVVLESITYGQPLKEAELEFTSNALGSFAWAEPDAVLNAGGAFPDMEFKPSALAMQNYDWTQYYSANGAWSAEDEVIRGRVALTVNKAEMTYTAPTPNTLTYNHDAQALLTAGTCEQGTVEYSMLEDGAFDPDIPVADNAGTYTVWYRVVPSAENANNYNAVAPASITVTIAKANPELKNVKADDVKDTTDLSAVVVSYETADWQNGMLRLNDGQTLKLGENTLTYTFTPDDINNLNEVTGSFKVMVLDTIPPTGEVTLSTSSWKEFLNAVSFGKFYKENQTLKVTAFDSFSGVAKVEYHESQTSLGLEGVKALTDSDWTAMEGTLSVTAEDAKQFIYYVRITDKSGNMAYLSSDGAEFDTTAPLIEGITDGKTYYTTQHVTISDKNIDTVTINGEKWHKSEYFFDLAGNAEAAYTIVATDKAGNTTTITVKMAPVQSLAEPVKDLTEETVTTDDRNNLQEIVDTADELLEAPSATDEEKAALEKIKADAEKLMAQVEEAVNAVQTEEVENTLQTTGENVTLSQKEDIQKAIETLEKAMENYGSNYSDSDKEELQQKLEELKAAEKTIADVEAAVAAIDELPKNVEPDDEETAKAITEAAKAYAALSEHGKRLVKDAAAKKLLALVEALTDYEIIKGDGAKWTEGDLTFTANGAYSKFAGIAVDGKEVDAKHYEAKSGSTIITLKESYLKTLSSGKHAIAVVYTDGAAEGTFTIKATTVNTDVPDTGDGANLMLWMCVSALSVVVLATQRRRNCVK